jgi:signal transduction histidine kinase
MRSDAAIELRATLWARLIVPSAALLYATAVVLGIADTPVGTGYPAAAGSAAVADLAAGLGLLAAGVVALWTGTRRLAGTLAALAGVAWFAPDWESWASGPAAVRSLGMVLAPLALALLFHLVLAFPREGLTGATRWAIGAVYVSALVVCVGRGLVRDPFLDPECWRNCTDNSFLLKADPSLARALDTIAEATALVTGMAMAGVAAARLLSLGTTARRLVGPVLVPGVLVGTTATVYAATLLFGPPEAPGDSRFMVAFVAHAASVSALALGLGWSAMRARRIRSAVVGLARDLGEAPPPGSLRAVLAEALADPDLVIAYRRTGRDRYVDAHGIPVALPMPGAGRAHTPILRDGRELAVVLHDATTLAPAELQHQIGAAARLAVENERLAAEALAQLHELRDSRERIVQTGDTERRRLERDLHDGAQQRLLTLTHRLRLAHAAAESADRADLAGLLCDAVDQALAALATLRELAHGIYPAVLAESGLAPALWTLAGGAPLPVEIADLDEQRYPAAIETAAYMTIAEAVYDAARRGASHAAVRVERVNGRLAVAVSDDASAAPAPSQSLADRVGALGGHLQAQPSLIQAEIPCA